MSAANVQKVIFSDKGRIVEVQKIHENIPRPIQEYEKEITNKHRTSYQSIKKVLIEHNISIRSISEVKDKYKIDRKVLVEDFKNGLTNPVIAKKHNTNKVLIATYKYKWKKGEI